MSTPVAVDEQARLDELRRYHVMDSRAEEAFNRLAWQAAAHYRTPYAMISLIDEHRVWCKASFGFQAPEVSSAFSFCSRTITTRAPLLVPDATVDRLFCDNPLVTQFPYVRFYAGAPIISPRGHPLGNICVADTVPRDFAPQDLVFLQSLATSVMSELELREALHSRQHEAKLLRSLHEAVLVINRDLNVTYLNEAAKRLYGVSDEVIGKSRASLVQYSYLTGADEQAAREATQRGESWTGEAVQILHDGRKLHTSVSVEPTFDANGERTGALVIVRDITARRRRLTLENDRRAMLELAARNAALPEVLTAGLRMLEAQLPEMTASILALRDGRLFEAAPSKLPLAYREAIEGIEIGEDVGSCGTAAHTQQLVVTRDLASDPRWVNFREVALMGSLRACWSAPIASSTGKVLGTFAVYASAPRSPEPAELELLKDAAHLTAILMERYQAQWEMERMALRDELTGLPNRTMFQEMLRKAAANAARNNTKVAVGLIDLNNFKTINDSLGHKAGDELLIQVAERLQSVLRVGGMVSRMSGDEFMLVVPDLTFSSSVNSIARRILNAFKSPFTAAGREVFAQGSLGFALYPDDTRDPEALLSLADVAMYRAKRQGTGWTTHSQTQSTPRVEDLTLESALHRALERGELSLHYQPVVHATTGAPTSMEALLRWTHPELGSIPPGTFIPIAEHSGLIVRIGEWVLREACAQLRTWQAAVPELRMQVNVSARQFTSPRLVASVRNAIKAAGVSPELLEVEITETSLMNAPDAVGTLHQLRELGVRVAIDDFGTGHSSLRYLKTFPAQTLKVDRSFVEDVGLDPEGPNAQIVRTIVSLARALKLETVAEGVETEAQAEFLRGAGCDSLQGWLFAKAMPAEQAQAWLAQRNRAHRGTGA